MSTRTLTFTFSGAVSGVAAGSAPTAAVVGATGMGESAAGTDAIVRVLLRALQRPTPAP